MTFKAEDAGAIGTEASGSVRRAVNVTIDRLEESSADLHSAGHRYASLLRLLWSRSSQNIDMNQTSADGQERPQSEHQSISEALAAKHLVGRRTADAGKNLDPLNGFSWRDLGAVGQFITNESATVDEGVFRTNHDEVEPDLGILDVFSTEWYDQVWSENGIVF